MTGIVALLIIPEEVPSLLAVLGLLFCWELHDIEIRQGHIKPQNLVAYLIPLRIELPTVGARPMLFTPWEAGTRIRCEDPLGCRCVIIPLEGQWPAAKQLSDRLNSQRGPVQLSEQDIRDLIHHGRGGKITEHDHLALRLLSTILLEETNPQAALSSYSQALAQATKGRHTLICAAAYLRSAEFFEQSGHSKDALQVTRNFFREFKDKERDCFLTKPQYDGMVARRSRLIRSMLYSCNGSWNWPR
ncbi:MAG: hypothetical protein E6K62_00700 [Nitrospirae bacterium]|nr:MAG: hypothetical protein E6K62_00700 [Nitrospirota bacterium]